MSPLHPDPLVLLPPQEILDTLCLNDCSGNGQCSKGVCLCAAGRAGADCGVSVAEVTFVLQPFQSEPASKFVTTQGPRVASLENHGLCDVRVRRCRSPRHREKITQRKMDGFDQKFSLNHLSNSQVQEFPCIGRQLCRQLGAGLSKEFEI